MRQETLQAVLEGRAWRRDVEAFTESTGATVVVVGLDATHDADRCPVCLAPASATGSSPRTSCFASALPQSGEAYVTCRAGLPCAVHALEGAAGVWLVVSGFVSSDGERRELLGRLSATGLPAKQARAVARATPTLRRDAAVALARLAASHLAALEASIEGHSERGLEYEILYEMGRGFDAGFEDGARLSSLILDRAMRLAPAEAGAVYLAEAGVLSMVEAAGEGDLLPAHNCPLGDGDLGHAAATRRSLLVSGYADEAHTVRVSSVVVPLVAGDEVLGVLVLATSNAATPMAGADLRLLELYAEQAGGAIANSRRYSQANEKVLELMQLNELSKALNADAELDRVVYLTTSVLDKVLEFEVGGLLLLGAEEPARVVLQNDVSRPALAELLATVAGMELSAHVLDRVAVVQNTGALLDDGDDGRKWNVLVADVSTSRPAAGYLFVASRDHAAFDDDDQRLLEAQAAHASVALEKARTYARLRGDLDKLVATLSAMADAAERTKTGHAGRVMAHALSIGEAMGLPADELEALRFAGLLHDIGKIGVSEEIILKPARLTAEEMAEVKRHAEIGANIVDQMEFLDSVAPIVLHHHERWDGGGYPKGLAGEQIPLPARILAVADAYDAMTCDRTYSKALPLASARIELERGAGKQFDPDVVATFVGILEHGTATALGGTYAEQQPPHLPA